MNGDLTTQQGLDALHASVIVCTYNRSSSLAHTLEALELQKLAPGTHWEVVVVDNNSNDDTKRTVESFAARGTIENVRYIFQGEQGLSHARNLGIRKAHGAILLFTDDDVRPEPDWVRQILEGMTQHKCDACGGYIAPDWEAPPPTWLSERFYGFLALRTGTTSTYQVMNPDQVPFGANMAFRREVFEQVGLFDVTRGRTGNLLAGGEEIDMFERLLASGGKVMFLGGARVHHRIEAFRATKRYMRRWRFQSSRNIAQSRGVPGSRRLLGVPLYVLPQLVRACKSALIGALTLPSDEAFHREMIVWHFLGLISGLVISRNVVAHSDSHPATTRHPE